MFDLCLKFNNRGLLASSFLVGLSKSFESFLADFELDCIIADGNTLCFISHQYRVC
jgi:hypothetical protein